MQSLPPEIVSWLRSFSRAVRERDVASATRLFDGKVISFGTVCPRVEGIDDLAAKQWNAVWPNTRDFDFDYGSARVAIEGNQAAVVANWKSTGLKRDGAPFQRRGRATIVLRKSVSWLAVHTHFSLAPQQADDPLFRPIL